MPGLRRPPERAALARAAEIAVALCILACGPAAQAAAAPRPAAAGDATMSAQVREHLEWVRRSGDHEGAPFVVIDKQQARLWLFDARARLQGQTPVLLGLSRGDASVSGIGERPMAGIRPHERTTPAGRFIGEAGHNAGGEDIVWVDYEAAVSMHRVRATNPKERRLQRLASATAADNRISYGCINVPAAFYDARLLPTLLPRGAASSPRPVVYLLPETLPRERLFTPVKAPAARPTPVSLK